MLPKSRRLLLGLLFAGSLLLALFLSPLGQPFRATLSNTPTNQAHHPQKSPSRDSHDRHLTNSTFKTRTWKVPADFTDHLAVLWEKENGPLPDDDPFAEDAGSSFGTAYLALKAHDVSFPKGSSVRFDLYTGALKIKNLPENLDQIAALIAALQPMPMWVLDRSLFSTGEPTATDHSADIDWITNKLRTIIIPEVHFEETTISEAVAFLDAEAKKHDTTETDPALRGVPLHIQEPGPSLVNSNGIIIPTDLANADIRELKLRNVPVATVLQYMCDSTSLRYRVDPDGVTLLMISPSGPPEAQTKHWHVAPAVIERLRLGGEPWNPPPDDPFADANTPPLTREEWIVRRRAQPLTDLLKDMGVTFPDPASFTYNPERSAMTITSTSWNVDLLEALFEHTALELSKEPALGTPEP